MINIIDEKGLVKDPYSKAVLTVDRDALVEHRRKKQLFKTMADNQQKLDQKVESLESDMNEMKQMMHTIIGLLSTNKSLNNE